jgi:hypothetical protein
VSDTPTTNVWRYFHGPRAARGVYTVSRETQAILDGVTFAPKPVPGKPDRKLKGLHPDSVTDRIWRSLNSHGPSPAPQLAYCVRCSPDDAYRALGTLERRGMVEKVKGTSPMGRPILIYSAVKTKDTK